MGKTVPVVNMLVTIFIAVAFIGMGLNYGHAQGALWKGIGGYLFGGFFLVMAILWLTEASKSK